jgi:hypothetical protein
MLGLHFDHKDRGDMFVRNACVLSPDRLPLSHICEVPISSIYALWEMEYSEKWLICLILIDETV